MYRSLWCCSRYRSFCIRFITSGAPAITPIFSCCMPISSLMTCVKRYRSHLLLPDHEEFADTIRLVLADRCFSQGCRMCARRQFRLCRVCPASGRKYLQPWIPPSHAAPCDNIALDRHDKALLAEAQSGLVVIKLEGFVDHVARGRQITGVVGLENPLIERFHLA